MTAGILDITVSPLGWMQRALCTQYDPELFFPEEDNPGRPCESPAIKICQRCPVRRECLEWSFEIDDRFAVLGGTTKHMRGKIRNRMEKLRRK